MGAYSNWEQEYEREAFVRSEYRALAHEPSALELEDVFRECVKGDPCGHCERCT